MKKGSHHSLESLESMSTSHKGQYPSSEHRKHLSESQLAAWAANPGRRKLKSKQQKERMADAEIKQAMADAVSQSQKRGWANPSPARQRMIERFRRMRAAWLTISEGRPRKESVLTRTLELKSQGKSYGEIAIQIRAKGKSGKPLTADAYRNLVRWETPRLCRGGSRSLTDTAVHRGDSQT